MPAIATELRRHCGLVACVLASHQFAGLATTNED